jgi:hypothetical protein
MTGGIADLLFPSKFYKLDPSEAIITEELSAFLDRQLFAHLYTQYIL